MLFNFDKVNDKKSLNLIIGGTLQINFRKTPLKFYNKTYNRRDKKKLVLLFIYKLCLKRNGTLAPNIN